MIEDIKKSRNHVKRAKKFKQQDFDNIKQNVNKLNESIAELKHDGSLPSHYQLAAESDNEVAEIFN